MYQSYKYVEISWKVFDFGKLYWQKENAVQCKQIQQITEVMKEVCTSLNCKHQLKPQHQSREET